MWLFKSPPSFTPSTHIVCGRSFQGLPGTQHLLCRDGGGGGSGGLNALRAFACGRSTGSAAPAVSAALSLLGCALLGAGSLAFAAVAAVLALSGALADAAQARALGLSAARVRLALGMDAPEHGLWAGDS